jgi:hypothetical protein
MKARFAAALIAASIRRKHGNTLIRTLRKSYGDHFAEGCRDDEKLGDVLHKMDEPSLSKLLGDRERGKLDEICRMPLDERAYALGSPFRSPLGPERVSPVAVRSHEPDLGRHHRAAIAVHDQGERRVKPRCSSSFSGGSSAETKTRFF